MPSSLRGMVEVAGGVFAFIGGVHFPEQQHFHLANAEKSQGKGYFQ